MPKASSYTLSSTNARICEDLLTDAGYDSDEHAGSSRNGIRGRPGSCGSRLPVLREHGLNPLADQMAP